jgi:hypothetical protein
MNALLITATILSVLWLLAYHRAPLWAWSVAISASLASLAFVSSANVAVIIALVVVLPLLAVLNIEGLRRRLVTAPLWRIMRHRMPTISKTEREALEAGTVGWDAELTVHR